MSTLTPIIAIVDDVSIPSLANFWGRKTAPAPTKQSARQSLAYARQCHSRARRDYDETTAELQVAMVIRDPEARAMAVNRKTLALRRCASVWAGTQDWVERAELALEHISKEQ